jgi:DNA-binding protein HU-beta
MNKSEMVAQVAADANLSKADAGRAVDAVLSSIEGELKSGGEVNLTGFGKFTVSERAAREGVNPQTGQKMQIKASKSPAFKAGNSLKESING